MTVIESDVDVKTPDGVADSALFHPEGTGTWPGVLIWTDLLGLRPVFRAMGKRLAAQGYVVLVPNPFYRTRRAPVTEGSLDLSKPEELAKVRPLAATLTPETGERDAEAFITFLDAQPQTNAEIKAGVHGYCFGGPFSFRTAASVPVRIGAAASFHGGGLVTAEPSSPHLLIPKMKAQVYVAVAANDNEKDPAAKETLKTAFAEANIPARVELYEGRSLRATLPISKGAAEHSWETSTRKKKLGTEVNFRSPSTRRVLVRSITVSKTTCR